MFQSQKGNSYLKNWFRSLVWYQGLLLVKFITYQLTFKFFRRLPSAIFCFFSILSIPHGLEKLLDILIGDQILNLMKEK